MPDRRSFLASLAATAAGAWPCRTAAQGAGLVQTVTGPVPAADLGMVLMHEHVLVDFVGADKVSRSRYDADEVVRVALPHLRQAKELGCRTIVESTPAFLGRNVALLGRLSREADLLIVTNTGIYGAGDDRFVPATAHKASARELAQKWIDEHTRGIDGTDVMPGFMKIGVDPGPLSAIDRKIVEAAALTHKATGLTIAAHTVDGVAAHQELDVLEQLGVPLEAFIWVHAHNEKDEGLLKRAAERGAWVEFDGIAPDSVERHVQLVKIMAEAGHLAKVLVAHDAGWYHVGEAGGGVFRSFDTVFRSFVPAIKEALGEEVVQTLLVTNPARALARRG